MRRSLTVALFVLLPTLANAAETKPDLDTQAMKAVALLYRQSMMGSLLMACTTTAFEKTERGYLFVSAAHCVDDDGKGRSADPSQTNFFITLDDPNNKTFYSAKPKGVGYQH